MKKICTKCLEEKSLSEFYKKKTAGDGRSSHCKSCINKYQKKYREENKELIQANNKEYYQDNKEELTQNAKDHYRENKEGIAKQRKKHRVNNKEKIADQQRSWRVNNKEGLSKKKKQYREENKEVIAAKHKVWRQENKEELTEKKRQYQIDNKEEIAMAMTLPSLYKDLKIPLCDNPILTEGGWTVECKMCGKRFLPSRASIQGRIGAYSGKTFGEHNFYCSDECKGACPLFNFKPQSIDPRSKLFIEKDERNKSRDCQTDHLKQLQCDEVGYNYCEKCGDIIDVELHHTQAVGTTGSITSAGHLLLCAGCHVKLHASCS